MKKHNQKGQALIELIIFLPLMFMFYSMISGFANAINGSINQQKVARGYFYYRLQGNSTAPKPLGGDYSSMSTFGMFYIGWKDKFLTGNDDAGKPIAPCYKLSIPLAPGTTDNCETKYSTPSTMFIRVQTVYGICGATYARQDQSVLMLPDVFKADISTVIGESSCHLIQ